MELTNIKLAPLWRRFLAFTSDVALWTISFFVFSISFKRYGMYNEQKDYLIIFWCFMFLLYQAIMFATNKGRTLGGIWFATKVVDIKYIKVSFWQGLFRSFLILCLIVTIYSSDYIIIGALTLIILLLFPLFKPFKQLRQFLWDKFSKTYVIDLSVEEENKQSQPQQ